MMIAYRPTPTIRQFDNYTGSPTASQNVMNFGPQTASNWTCNVNSAFIASRRRSANRI